MKCSNRAHLIFSQTEDCEQVPMPEGLVDLTNGPKAMSSRLYRQNINDKTLSNKLIFATLEQEAILLKKFSHKKTKFVINF